MKSPPESPVAPNPGPESPAAPQTPAGAPAARAAAASPSTLWRVACIGAALCAILAVLLAWSGRQRVQALETELVRRQQASSEQATEARLAARQAQEVARESAAKMALLEARVAESAVQRSQVEELMQVVARSRDENVLADIESALRVAMQHSAITGGSEPMLAALKLAEDRLARNSQPKLERVRRAIAADIERTRSVGVTDIAVLTIRLDEAIRAVDDLPLLSRPDERRGRIAVAPPVPPAASASGAQVDETSFWQSRWQTLGRELWAELRGLVRVTPIEQTDAMLVSPEQAWFLRENLKLRLLNARLALLSRQFDTAQSDLRDARAALERYFDRSARNVQSTTATVKQVMAQARQVTVPRPDATLAAIAAAAAGR